MRAIQYVYMQWFAVQVSKPKRSPTIKISAHFLNQTVPLMIRTIPWLRWDLRILIIQGILTLLKSVLQASPPVSSGVSPKPGLGVGRRRTSLLYYLKIPTFIANTLQYQLNIWATVAGEMTACSTDHRAVSTAAAAYTPISIINLPW
jgi:hypothetical protein